MYFLLFKNCVHLRIPNKMTSKITHNIFFCQKVMPMLSTLNQIPFTFSYSMSRLLGKNPFHTIANNLFITCIILGLTFIECGQLGSLTKCQMHLFDQLQKGVWKENSIKCIQTWANDIEYISVQ
jgi:hypothetical protein